jgi:hypothetical protein
MDTDEVPSPPPAEPPPVPDRTDAGPQPKNAGDVVNEGHETRPLEEKIAELEDKYATEKKAREDLENKISKTRKISSPTRPGKSFLDDLNDFWEGK